VAGRSRARIIIGTRGSALALWQAEWIAAELRRHHADLEVRLERIMAPADAAPDIPIAQIGTKGLFTKTLEDALLAGRIDVAVHSLKDLASISPPGLALAAIPRREDPREALVATFPGGLDALPSRARVGTSAPRRRAQLLHMRPDLQILDVRGNVDTRLRKLHEGQYDALVLAAAGLHRLAYRDAITAYLDPAVMVPAGGQGALGIQARADDARVHDLVAPLADRATTLCCTAERRLQEVLEGGCRVPIGALALLDGDTLTLDAVVASEDGTLLVRDRLTGPAGDPRTAGERLAERRFERRALDGGHRTCTSSRVRSYAPAE
jgi:hydroxymethylbilane synthase